MISPVDPLIPVSEADALIRSSIKSLPSESVTLSRAIGRQLLSPIVADRELPPYDRAMMDGVAFNSATVDSLTPTLEIVGLHPAGSPPPPPLSPGQAWEIMTGAVIPPDCDTIVPYENLSADHSYVLKPFAPGAFIHRRGTDSKANDILVPAGTPIGAPEIAIASSVGQTRLIVSSLPRVGILSTGDEAIHPAAHPESWQIRRSNGPALAALISQFGYPLDFHKHASDEAEELSVMLDQALQAVDVLIISGGISKGKKDLIRTLLEERRGTPAFHGVAQKPGKPLAFWPGSPNVFALPGNPVSTLATFARFVRPTLLRLQGLEPPTRLVRAPDGLQALNSLTWLAPTTIRPQRKPQLRPPRNSGDFAGIATSTGIIEVPPSESFKAEGPFVYYPYSES
ncbi:MAG: molybdopterin molybdotransferase MoeA [Verrucomicrobiales bacterium]